jgi:hypothetical protein
MLLTGTFRYAATSWIVIKVSIDSTAYSTVRLWRIQRLSMYFDSSRHDAHCAPNVRYDDHLGPRPR